MIYRDGGSGFCFDCRVSESDTLHGLGRDIPEVVEICLSGNGRILGHGPFELSLLVPASCMTFLAEYFHQIVMICDDLQRP